MFSCPLCKQLLREEPTRWVCPDGHSFDKAKSGYINLLPPSGKGQHGDDRTMLLARRDFLNGGYYAPLLKELARLTDAYTDTKTPCLLDAGCGECYYTAGVSEELSRSGKTPTVYGVDISKEALILGGKRHCGAHLAAASLYKLPFEGGGFDLVYNVFAPLSAEEFHRVLKPCGVLLLAIPLERHLWELKATLYKTPYENKVADTALPCFEFLGRTDVRFEMCLSDATAIDCLFKMTPYYYRTPKSAAAQIASLDTLSVNAEFAILAYRKI